MLPVIKYLLNISPEETSKLDTSTDGKIQSYLLFISRNFGCCGYQHIVRFTS